MNNYENQYKDIIKKILSQNLRENRTNQKTKSIFFANMTIDLKEGFPLLTLREMQLKSILSELLWFIEGSTDDNRLSELNFGKTGKKTIWTDNANDLKWIDKAAFQGDCGRIYGAQWRDWRDYKGRSHDQLTSLLRDIRNNPTSRRLILQNYNPGELDLQCLPACHMFSQFYIENNELSCLFYMRSNDFYLGNPYNIASYALLTHILANMCDLNVGKLIYVAGDVHLYENQIEAAEEILKRDSFKMPKLNIMGKIKDFDNISIDSFKLVDYNSHIKLSVPMVV